jgi:DNA repair protein RadD
MILRPYQSRAIESLRALRRAGHRRILLVAPTGSGKTVIFCAMIATAVGNGLRVLVVAHRKEILDQFWGALRTHHGIEAGVIRADDERAFSLAPVQLASVQTLTRRDLPPAELVIVDEAHRTPGESYRRVLEAYPKATIIGGTATPTRLDGSPLKEHFDSLCEVARYSELIASGALMAPVVYAPVHVPDLSRVKKIAGDYHEGELEKVMVQPHVIGDVVAEWKEKAHGRSTVVFAVGVEHSKAITAAFLAAGVRAAHLDGTTSEDERLQVLLKLETGSLDVVSNVGVLCEGWDQPRVKCCVMARPTLSLTLYMQCVGRILRPFGDLPPIVLDHAGNTERHGLPHEDRVWTLDGKAQRVKAFSHHICKQCFAYVEGNPCPLCGYEAPVKHREVRTAPGSLAPVGGAYGQPVDERHAYFERMVERARHDGFKPGYAAAKFREKFGAWPPWQWSQDAKREFAASPTWQEDQRKRERTREFWQQKNEARTRELEAAPPMAPESEFSGIDEL